MMDVECWMGKIIKHQASNIKHQFYGELAQLGERLLCTQEVSGSIPLFSTMNAIKTKSLIQVVRDGLN
jgi:hypothetical protein